MIKSPVDNAVQACLLTIFLTLFSFQLYSQELYPVRLPDQWWHGEQRVLRYQPDGEDFVITNGERLFTRALYGTHSAFRVEAGDRPEFALYMPGLGGNFKLGIVKGDSSKWLTEAKTITARYRAGSMIYSVQDPLLHGGIVTLTLLAMADAEGFLLKARFQHVPASIQLICAFGGASGKKFSRDGDMGPDPPSNFFLKPENCKDNSYTINNEKFTLQYGSGLQVGQDGRYFQEDTAQVSKTTKTQLLQGVFPVACMLGIADATQSSTAEIFSLSSAGKAPVLHGKMKISNDTDYYFSIYNPATRAAFDYSDASDIFKLAEKNRKEIARRIIVKTPDPFINTIGGTLATASDANWEEPSYMHGAVGWRMRLNGWRGAYTADALGWHDRAKMHLESYALSQLTDPPVGPVIADTAMHVSRSLEKLGVGMFTSGYISRDPGGKSLRAHHYDMNLVFFDILLRHFAWTGDTVFLRKMWPVIKRHLEWENRNFDPDGDGLYDAYAAIWASDALQYSGGAVTHASAYNFYANKKAAGIARLLGEDPALYNNLADKIQKAMNSQLWMPEKGSYAEYKDALGNRMLHSSPALWTIYHSMDSETLNPFQAYQSMRYIDTDIPHIPVRATGLDGNNYYTLSTTSWMPYTWSLNNVALAESMHTTLANWQAGRTDEAFRLFKSEVLASMYLGGSPGNFVQISYYDAIRAEAYRDFGDPVGIFSRALTEGLFGIVPDALNNTLLIRPGLPSAWNYASFSTPDIAFDFKRNGQTDAYVISPSLPIHLHLRFQVIARGQVKSITVNGKPVAWKNLPASIGKPVIEIDAPTSAKYLINIRWQGAKPVLPSPEKTYGTGSVLTEIISGVSIRNIVDPQQALTEIHSITSGFTAKVKATTGNYTVFAQVSQGALSWWMPLCFRVEKAVSMLSSNGSETNSRSFRLQNNTGAEVAASVTVNTYHTDVSIAAGGVSNEIAIPAAHLVTGTNAVHIRLKNDSTITGFLTDWTVSNPYYNLDGLDLSSFFNDPVTQIFKNKYLSTRPQTTTLQLPWQGTGDWPHPLETHAINDSGLRRMANKEGSIFLPQGLYFRTPGRPAVNNVIFVSQWDNYPQQYSVPVSGSASHAWFLMAGSTNPMQSQLDNGVVTVEYTDGTKDTLALRNPATWWPIEKDYYTDGYAFALKQPRPIRIHLKTAEIVTGADSKARFNGKEIDGGAATVLDLPLDKSKTLKAITVKALANDVVIGLMAITLLR